MKCPRRNCGGSILPEIGSDTGEIIGWCNLCSRRWDKSWFSLNGRESLEFERIYNISPLPNMGGRHNK